MGIDLSCGIGHRRGLDPALLWLWRRLAAVAPIRHLAWEPPYAEGVALEKTKKDQKIIIIIIIKNKRIKIQFKKEREK